MSAFHDYIKFHHKSSSSSLFLFSLEPLVIYQRKPEENRNSMHIIGKINSFPLSPLSIFYSTLVRGFRSIMPQSPVACTIFTDWFYRLLVLVALHSLLADLYPLLVDLHTLSVALHSLPVALHHLPVALHHLPVALHLLTIICTLHRLLCTFYRSLCTF